MSKEKIVIVGAGLAGLTTAYRLMQKHYEVEIYEARPRVGGRVHTVLIRNLEGHYSLAELGAFNLTDGGESQFIFSLIQEMALDIVESVSAIDRQFYDGTDFHANNDFINSISKADLFNKVDNAVARCHSMAELLQCVFPNNALVVRMLSFFLTGYEGIPPHLLSTQLHNINTLKYMLAGGLSEAHQESVIHIKTIQGGNALLPIKLAEKLGSRVHLNKTLLKVSQQNDNKITLFFSDGSQVVCNKLILAIPCSVYKDIEFDPTLIEPARLKLIQSIYYGQNAKLFMPIQLAKIPQAFFYTDWAALFFNRDNKLINLYIVGDDGAQLFEQRMHKDAISFVNKSFEVSLLDESWPCESQDVNFAKNDFPVVKSWVKDPYAKGSYSTYDIILQEKIDEKIAYQNITVKQLFAPIDNKIFFVGEHATIINEIGTMEAAVESGERIAKLF